MSFGKSKAKQSSTQSGTSTTTADPASLARYNEQSQGILDTAKNYAAEPYKAFQGETAAGLTPDQIRARQTANASVGNWQGILGEAEGTVRGALDFGSDDIAAFRDPYELDVINSSLALYDEGVQRQLNEQADAVAKRGAWGNSSRELGEGEIRRGAALDRANLAANMKSTGYKQAVDNAFRKQQADYQGGGILGSMAGQRQQLSQNDVAMLEQLGATEQQINQLRIDAERAEWDKAAADRLQKTMLELQARSGILSANPFGQSTTSSGSSSGTSSGTNFGISFVPKAGTSG